VKTLLRDDSEVIQASYSGGIQGWLSVKGSALSKKTKRLPVPGEINIVERCFTYLPHSQSLSVHAGMRQ